MGELSSLFSPPTCFTVLELIKLCLLEYCLIIFCTYTLIKIRIVATEKMTEIFSPVAQLPFVQFGLPFPWFQKGKTISKVKIHHVVGTLWRFFSGKITMPEKLFIKKKICQKAVFFRYQCNLTFLVIVPGELAMASLVKVKTSAFYMFPNVRILSQVFHLMISSR
jgi:hypothetical protein